MKETKIFCDCCGKEMTKSNKDTFGDIDVNVITDKLEPNRTLLDGERRITDRFKSDEVCGECAKKIYGFIKQLKK
jgi:hypothetical protein